MANMSGPITVSVESLGYPPGCGHRKNCTEELHKSSSIAQYLHNQQCISHWHLVFQGIPLVHILKVGVLLIGHVIESRSVEFVGCAITSVTQRSALLLLALVLPLESISQDKEQDNLDAVGYQNGANAKLVGGSLLGAVEEWAGDIAHTGAQPDHAGDDHLLGLTPSIGGDE